jgi:mannose-6-phosphate isomerase-like protein (cupin superfamily)
MAGQRSAGERGKDVNNQPPDKASNNRAGVSGRVLGPQDGEICGAVTTVRDRFMVESVKSGGGFSLVEHLMPPRTLAAPLHRHSREDEYSFVLEGRVGAHFHGVEVFADAGDLIFKPRGEWHTFWNAGDAPARILEIISPGGFERAFREMHALGEALDAAAMAQIATRYGVDVDFERTGPIIERHGLMF